MMRAQAVAAAVGRGAAEDREAGRGRRGEWSAGGVTSRDRQIQGARLLHCAAALLLLTLAALLVTAGLLLGLWLVSFLFPFCFSFPLIFSTSVFAARSISLVGWFGRPIRCSLRSPHFRSGQTAAAAAVAGDWREAREHELRVGEVNGWTVVADSSLRGRSTATGSSPRLACRFLSPLSASLPLPLRSR